jgi:D-alanyl-lipoteichoic acid acyltransferase DltB (MBOAT superfamily)
MLFTTPHFVIFFIAIALVYHAIPSRYRQWFLLAASWYFILCAGPWSLTVLLVQTFVAWGGGILIARHRRSLFFCSLSVCIATAILTGHKYPEFFFGRLHLFTSDTAFPAVAAIHETVLPLGISFYTMKTISYLFDVYRGKAAVRTNPVAVALYTGFFPQIAAGPIQRAESFLQQIDKKESFRYNRAVSGLRRVLWGSFQKVVVADTLAVMVNAVYGKPQAHTGAELVLATLFFSFQIYWDFAGYSNMAIGLGRILGFETRENFLRPYLAISPRDFWRRWHISLSTWFRDYIYIPLGGNRRPPLLWAMLILLVFLLSGMWHGVGWTFGIWGGVHGILLIVTNWFARIPLPGALRKMEWNNRVTRFFQGVITFLAVTLAWIPFRANDLADALYIAGNSFRLNLTGTSFDKCALSPPQIGVMAVAIIGVIVVDFLDERRSIGSRLAALPAVVRWSIYLGVALAVLNVTVDVPAEFIYMRF